MLGGHSKIDADRLEQSMSDCLRCRHERFHRRLELGQILRPLRHCAGDGAFVFGRADVENFLQIANVLRQLLIVEAPDIGVAANDASLDLGRLVEERNHLRLHRVAKLSRHAVANDIEKSPLAAGAIETRELCRVASEIRDVDYWRCVQARVALLLRVRKSLSGQSPYACDRCYRRGRSKTRSGTRSTGRTCP